MARPGSSAGTIPTISVFIIASGCAYFKALWVRRAPQNPRTHRYHLLPTVHSGSRVAAARAGLPTSACNTGALPADLFQRAGAVPSHS